MISFSLAWEREREERRDGVIGREGRESAGLRRGSIYGLVGNHQSLLVQEAI